jgi:predicted CopG family antitoxin
MKTYTQALRTGVDNLWDTPKTERKFDMDLHGGCTLDAYNTQSLSHYKSENESFSYLVKIKKMINKKRKSLLLIATLFALQGANTAHATTSNVDSLRLYAHSRLVNFEQFLCFNKIITKESNWRVNAKNGSHFGLGQMRSQWYRNLDGFRQIDQTIKYIGKRYQTPCKAWAFHQRNNWY